MYSMAEHEELEQNERQENVPYKSNIQRLLEDPNIRIVTDVPGLSWHIEYKVKPQEKKGFFAGLFKRSKRQLPNQRFNRAALK